MTCSLPIQSFVDVYSNVKRSKTSNSSPATPLYLSVSLHLYSSTSLHLDRSTFLCHYFSTIHNDEMTEEYTMPELSGALLCGVVPVVPASTDPYQPLAEPSPERTRSRTPPTLRSIDRLFRSSVFRSCLLLQCQCRSITCTRIVLTTNGLSGLPVCLKEVPKALQKNCGSAFAKAPNMAARVVYFV